MNTRPMLTFDGKGINGPDEYRSRVATLTEYGHSLGNVGPLLAGAPLMWNLLQDIADGRTSFGIASVQTAARTLLDHIAKGESA